MRFPSSTKHHSPIKNRIPRFRIRHLFGLGISLSQVVADMSTVFLSFMGAYWFYIGQSV